MFYTSTYHDVGTRNFTLGFYSGPLTTGNLSNSTGLKIGSRYPYTPSTFDYNGRLSDVRMYLKALSDSEISDMYSGCSWPTDSLVYHIPLNEKTGDPEDIVNDLVSTESGSGMTIETDTLPIFCHQQALSVDQEPSCLCKTFTIRVSAPTAYRYGFNGMEKDGEISEDHYTSYYRESDNRLGQWWSIDPKATAHESPYAMMGRSPILYMDPEGDKIWRSKDGNNQAGEKTGPGGQKVTTEMTAEQENMVIEQWEDKTGLSLSVGIDGYISYEKDNQGNPIVKEGAYSASARADLVSQIDDVEMTVSIYATNSSDIVSGAASDANGRAMPTAVYNNYDPCNPNAFVGVRPRKTTGAVYLDFSDLTEVALPRTIDIGMISLHELLHTYYGLEDNTLEVFNFSNSPRNYPNTPIQMGGYPGDVVNKMNTYRRELGLEERASYATFSYTKRGNSYLIFMNQNDCQLNLIKIWK